MISESVNNYPIDQCWQLLGWVFVGSIPPHTCPSVESNSTNISFDTSHVSSSVTMDWSLVCGNAGLHVSHQLVVLSFRQVYSMATHAPYMYLCTVVAKKDKTTLLVKLLIKSFYPFWPPLYIL